MATQNDGTAPDQPTNTKDDLVRFVAIPIALIFTAISLVLLLPPSGRSFWLLLTGPIALISGYYAFPSTRRARWQAWLVDYVVIMTAIAALWVILLALVPWAVVNFWWMPEYEQQRPLVMLDGADQIYVTASLPGGVLADGQPQSIVVRVSNTAATTQTVTTTLQLPAETVLATVTGPELVLIVGPQQTVTQTLSLANSTPPQSLREVETIGVTAVSAGKSGTTTAEIITEGVYGLRLRRFVNTAVNTTASPLIILTVFLLIVSALLQKNVQTYNAKKTAERTSQAAQQKLLVTNIINQLRQNLVLGEIESAMVSYRHWQEDENLRGFCPEERSIAENLLKLARVEDLSQVTSYIQNGRSWPNETVASFVAAWRACRKEISGTCTQRLSSAYFLLPISQVKSDLQNELVNINIEIIAHEKEKGDFSTIRDWPVTPKAPMKLTVNSPWIIRVIQSGRNPFAQPQGELDAFNLFHTAIQKQDIAFWGGNSLFNLIFDTDRPIVIVGATGSGRTVMAQALHYFAPRREVFALYLSGTPEPEIFRSRFTFHLLDFVLTHPRYLRLFTNAERALFAQMLVQTLGEKTAGAQIEAFQALGYPTLGQPSLKMREEIKREHISNNEQLQLLFKALLTASAHTEPIWASEVSITARALKFKNVLLILDVPETAPVWLKEKILPQIIKWHIAGLTTILFLPSVLQKQLQIDLSGIYLRSLVWQEEEFRKMLGWRYKAVAGPYQKLENHFEPGVLDILIDHCSLERGTYNPRRFIELWQKIVEDLPEKEEVLITANDVSNAVKAVVPVSEKGVEQFWSQDQGVAKQKIDLSQQPAALPPLPAEMMNNRSLLRKILINYFSLSELRTLCFDFDLDYDNFPREKSELAREMIAYFDRHGIRLDNLWQAVCRQRRNVCRDVG
ncbi:MAG: hypothetical protein KC421_11135 [Anaerolineales bacterium]|nr:hypothetical protein [Anaerolineales bacterium]